MITSTGLRPNILSLVLPISRPDSPALSPLHSKVAGREEVRYRCMSSPKRLKMQLKNHISERPGVKIAPTFPRVAGATVLTVRIPFAPPANSLILLDKETFWSNGRLCPTYPWLASTAQGKAGRRDAFGTASWRDLSPQSLTPVLVVPLPTGEVDVQ